MVTAWASSALPWEISSLAVLALIGVQGAVGYAQYFSGLPAGLVWVHVANSVVIWVTALLLLFALRDRGPAATEGLAGTEQARAAGTSDGSPATVAPGVSSWVNDGAVK